MIKILFICHGNICRSTLAESVFTHKVNSLGLAHNFEIDSFATSREEIGNPPHYGTVNKLREEHIPLVPHHAKQITWKDYERADYIIGMDTANIRNLNRMLKNDPDGKVYKFLSFTGSGRDIADPWYTGDFEATYRDVVEGCNGFSGVSAPGRKNLKNKKRRKQGQCPFAENAALAFYYKKIL